MTALTALRRFRSWLKPISPPWLHRALRLAWYAVVLPPLRLASRISAKGGEGGSSAVPSFLLAQYDLASEEEFRSDGEDKAAVVCGLLERFRLPLPKSPRILDFGCGLGSALLALRERFPVSACFACDLKEDAVAFLRRNYPEVIAETNRPMPPLPEAFAELDLVFAISVWTHMPEAACESWIAHMHDRLKPGGILLFTFAEPSTDLVRRHGFDPATLPAKVTANGGCLHDRGTDMTYIDTQWIERQARGRFEPVHVGPTGYIQWGAVLRRLS